MARWSAHRLTECGEAGDCEQTDWVEVCCGLAVGAAVTKIGGKSSCSLSPRSTHETETPLELFEVSMCPFCLALLVAWSARGYWLLSELLCCYARCCRSEGLCQWTCRAFVHTRSFWKLSLKCLPSVMNRNAVISGRYGYFKRRVIKKFHVIASAGMTHTYRFILFCRGVFGLLVPVQGGFLRQARPCPSLAPGNPWWCRVRILCY